MGSALLTEKPSPLAMPLALVLVLLLLGAAGGIAGAAEVLFEQNFDGVADGTDAGQLGFTVDAAPEQSEWTVQGGYLEGILHHGPHKGGSICVSVPKLERGRLEYRVWLGSQSYRHCGFRVRTYGIFTYYHGYGTYRMAWRRYTSKYTDGTKGRDVVLQTRISPGEWHQCRIEWDAAKNVILYYVDDMENPSYVDTKVAVFSKRAEENQVLRLGNYGLCSGDIEVRIDDIRLSRVDGSAAEAGERTNVIVVDGFDYEATRIGEAFGGYDAGRVIRFPVVWGNGERAKMTTRLDKIITGRQLGKARLLIMSNAPAPCLESYTQQELLGQVKEAGLKVLILGGLFSLGKGQYDGTAFEQLCPVGLKGRWAVRQFDTPQILRPTEGADFVDLNWAARPAVLFYHDVDVPDGAEICLRAGEIPILVVRRLGRGYVAAFLSSPIGKAEEGTLAYWEWGDWPKLLRRICEKLMEK